MDHVAGDATARRQNPVTFSQHGELVGESTQYIRVNGRRHGVVSQRKSTSVGCHNHLRGSERGAHGIGLSLEESVPGQVSRNQTRPPGARDVRARPLATRTDIQQTPLAGQLEVLAEGLGLRDCRVAVEPDLLTQRELLELSCGARALAVVFSLKEIAAVLGHRRVGRVVVSERSCARAPPRMSGML